MAENKQVPKTFKWGDKEYLVDDLLKAHADQQNNFYAFAKAKGQYDDAALAGLRNAMDNRINAVREGKSFSADGILDGDVVDNTTIQTQKKGLFKKDKYVEQDNTEWAKYYLNKLVQNINPYEKEKTTDRGAWDVSKHGFEAYLAGQGLNAQDIFENYDLRDANNPDAARSFAQRDAELRKHLGNYKIWLEDKSFDFTKNDNEWDDNFMTTLSDLINNQDWSNRTALASSLRKLGSGEGYATAFTSDRWDLTKSKEELNAENKAAKNEEEAKLKADRLQAMQDELLNSHTKDKGVYYSPVDYSTYSFKNGVSQNFMNYYSDLNAQERANLGTYLGTDNQVWDNAWQKLMNSFKMGTTYSDANKSILLQRFFEDAPNGFTDLGDGTYLINDSVNDKGQGYIYDPRSGFTQRRHLSEFANQNESIRKAYEEILYKNINDKYGTNYHNRNYISFEKGGIVKSQLGGAVLKPYNVDDQYKEEGAVNNVETKTQKAKSKYIDSDNKSEANPNAGLTAGQSARIAYAIADIGSAVAAFAPGAGTAISAGLGLTSTFGNFISDWTDDAVTAGEMWKNFGMNLGMDALGLIPGGGAASKMGKVIKSLKTIVPTIIALPGVASMLANTPEIAKSWKKAFDGDPENGGSKMTYQDYMNILQVLNVATAGTTIGANVSKSAKRKVKPSDMIAIDVNEIDGNNKQRKAIVLEGDDAVKFKEANAKGEAQKFINGLEGEGKYIINETTSFNKGKFWGKDDNGKFKVFNQNPLGTSKTGQANVLDLRFDSKTGTYYARTGRWEDDLGLNGGELINASETYKARVKEIEGKINNTVNELKTAMQRRADRVKETTNRLTPEKTRLGVLQEKLHGIPSEAELQTKRDQLQTMLNSNEQALNRKKQEVTQSEEALNTLLGRTGITQEEIVAHNQVLRSARGKVSGNKAALQGYESTKQQVESELANVKSQLNLHTQTQQTKATIDRLENILNNTKSENHTNAYTRLQNMLEELKNAPAYTGGRSVNLDMAEILKKAGVKDAFQQGGSINRNKINKFLNYGKR